MEIDPSRTTGESLSQLLNSVIVPRPIAWVSTVDTRGVRNLAPFSFFNIASGAPPILMVSINQREGHPKDTLANILATREFVVNVVDEELAPQMNCTSGNYPPEVDEFEVAQLAPLPSVKVQAPQVGAAPISLECVLVQTLKFPRSSYTVVFGEVVYFRIDDRVLNERGRVDAEKLKPIGRLGGSGWYTTLGRLFEMVRPP
jgi:flavin reductase (DIM6/NTAB) family NADH-FMN oxidoreductase RutF